MEISKNKIRAIFYIGTITVVLLLLIILSGTYFSSLKAQSELKIDQISEIIYDMKKVYVEDIVNRTIQGIDIEKNRLMVENQIELDELYNLILEKAEDNLDIYDIYQMLIERGIESHILHIVFYDLHEEQVEYAINDLAEDLEDSNWELKVNEYELSKELTVENYSILLYVNPDEIDSQVKQIMTNRIRQEKLMDNGYIWINEIINYDGGDRYAIRLVHPNLIETEGDYLSTETTDDHGNKPYLKELNGLKQDGELYQDYYFKKMGSDEVSHKLSFSKLYKPYNWAIGTGVYLDDIDSLVEKEKLALEVSEKEFLSKTLTIVGICIFLTLMIIILFERLINRLIQRFQDEVNKKNEAIILKKKKIETIAFKDSLTGLLTRRAMQSNLEMAFASALRHESNFVVAIGDIDHFKRINDQYGHFAGDHVLTSISKLFVDNTRIEDSISRWGGEEFLFILTETSLEDVRTKIDQLRELIEKEALIYEGETIKMTISFGLSAFTNTCSDLVDILKTADKNLYLAKTTGRNKVVG